MSEVVEIEGPQTIDGLIKQAVHDAIQSPDLIKQVRKAANEAVQSAINSAFGYNSDFREGITETVKRALPTVQVDDLANFSNACREVIQRRLSNLANETAADNLNRVLERILPSEPVITMKELRDAYREKQSRGECRCHDSEYPEEYDEFKWEIDDSDMESSTGHYWDLRIAPKLDASSYYGDSMLLRFRELKETPGLSECWAAEVGKKGDKIGSLFMGALFGFDAMVFRLATSTAKMKRD